MRNKIIYGVLAVIFVVAIIMAFVKGLNINLYYGEGYTISFTEKETIELKDIQQIAKEIWGNNVLVQRMEFFNDSAEIKVKDYTDEQLTQLKDKLNEKYSSDIQLENFKIEHVSNVRIRHLIEPYILPIGLSLLGILVFYAARYRATRKMLGLLLYLVIAEGIVFSAYAIGRLPVGNLTMPIVTSVFALVVLGYTMYSEKTK